MKRLDMLDIDFASLLCSRLCHDLVSPVGALTNGVELLSDETDASMREQCMQLLADSARQTANKLKFFRLAFGAAGRFNSLVDMREIQSAIEGIFSPDKVKIDWQVNVSSMPKAEIKIFMNMALLAGEALLRGGILVLAAERVADQSYELRVRAEGSRTLLPEELRRALTGAIEAKDVDARTAPAYLIYKLLGVSGIINVSPPDQAVVVISACTA